MKTLTCVVAALAMWLDTAFAQQLPPPPQNEGPGGDGPWNHRILLATSKDGLTWTMGKEILAERASVPELFAGPDGRPIVLFVDASGESRRGALGAKTQRDDGTWTRVETNLRGADPDVVRLKDGSYRAYTKERDGAIIVFTSRDGLNWERVDVAFREDQYRFATDPDVFETGDGWVMLLSLGPKLLRCASSDGLKFSAGDVIELGGSVSDTVAVEGGWRTYFHVNGNPRNGEKMHIRSAFTADGKSWKTETGNRVVASEDGAARLGVADPAPLRLKDGTWLMALKSFMAAPSFSANGNQGFQPRGGPGQGPQQGGPGGPNGAGTDRPGPWDADVIVYRGSTNGTAEKLATFERAGVPTITRLKDGRLMAAHQYFPENDRANFDKVAVRFSKDDGKKWTEPAVIKLEGLPEGMRFPFDPTLVALPDGRVRMYFTSLRGRQFDEAVPAIYSAISTNGVDYVFEPAMRFGVEGRTVIDCAAVLHQGVFHLFSPDNGAQLQRGERPGNESPASRPLKGVGYHATSRDGLNFTREADVKIDERRQWLGNAQSDGKQITFFGTGMPMGGGPGAQQRGNLWMATSADGKAWRLVNSPAVMGGDPGAVVNGAGELVVVITGEPRAGTASARNRPRPRGN